MSVPTRDGNDLRFSASFRDRCNSIFRKHSGLEDWCRYAKTNIVDHKVKIKN